MYFNYKIQITFLKSNSNTFCNYFGYDGQNTKYKIHFLKVIKIQNNKVSVTEVRQLGVCLTSDVCLSRTSGLGREQRGLGRLKLAQMSMQAARAVMHRCRSGSYGNEEGKTAG